MSNLSVQFLPEQLRIIDSATFTGAFQDIGGPLLHPACMIKIVNESNVSIVISEFDGIPHDVVPASSFYLYDVSSNRATEGGLYISQGTQYQVRGAAGVGLVYLIVRYPGP